MSFTNCPICKQTGRCSDCSDHVAGLAKLKGEIESGHLSLAEASVMSQLQRVSEKEMQARTFEKTVVTGGLAVAGTLLFGGLGLIGSVMAGNAIAENKIVQPIKSFQAKKADLYHSLALIYALQQRIGDAKQAWVRALIMFDEHQPSIWGTQGVRLMQIDLPGLMGLKVHLFNGLDGITSYGSDHVHHMSAGSWVNNGQVQHHSPNFMSSHMSGAFHHSSDPLGGQITLPSDHIGGMLIKP